MAKYKAKDEETPLLFFVAGEVRRAARGAETPFFFFPFTQNLREPECDYWTAAPHIVAFKKNYDCTRRIESLSSSPEGSLSKAVFEVTSVDFLVYLNTVDSSKTPLGICSYLTSQ